MLAEQASLQQNSCLTETVERQWVTNMLFNLDAIRGSQLGLYPPEVGYLRCRFGLDGVEADHNEKVFTVKWTGSESMTIASPWLINNTCIPETSLNSCPDSCQSSSWGTKGVDKGPFTFGQTQTRNLDPKCILACIQILQFLMGHVE